MRIFITFALIITACAETPNEQKALFQKSEEKLSKQILKILDHYKQEDPVGIPGAPVPDPLSIPPLAHSFSLGKMNFKNVQVYGLSKFKLKEVKIDLTAMKVEAGLTIDTLNVNGNYTLSTFFSSAKGPFTVKLTGVNVKANATLTVERAGQLEAQEMSMDITFKTISMDFKGLGFFANMFQGIINSVGNFIFDSIKPFILREVNSNMIKDVNQQVRKLPQRFPNSITPLDQMLVDVRHKIRNAKYDPYQVTDYNTTVGIFDIQMSHTWLYGLATVHREGDVVFQIKNNTVYALLEVGTQKLEGTSNWEFAFITGFLSRAGSVRFSVEYIRVQVLVSQTMDTRNSPVLEDIQLELGNIQIRFDGAGSADYVIEFAVNVLPNLLRYQIMDALESPVRQRIQQEFDKINIEEIINDNVDKIDNPQDVKFL